MHEIYLSGCSPTPLASYLKALGILRLIAEQKEKDVSARWDKEEFVLTTSMDKEDLMRFFLDEYKPTPIIAPWNGRSGFLEGEDADDSNRSGALMLREFKGQIDQRFYPLKKMILLIEKNDFITNLNLLRAKWKEIDKEVKKKKKDGQAISDEEAAELTQLTNSVKRSKQELLSFLRAELPDSILTWFDACITLGEERSNFVPLLGSGGLDGSMDLSVNFLQRLVGIFNLEKGVVKSNSTFLLRSSLYGNTVPLFESNAIGYFSPGSVGGPNATTGFETGSLINSWDFVLMLEGVLLFAGAATRRLESSDNTALSYPFTVRPTGSGAGSTVFADEAPARAEMWLPLWGQAARFNEVRTLLAEGRVTLGRRAARDGLDFIRAVATLGINRGITAFQRYSFLKRSGKNYLAIPLSRIKVEENLRANLIQELDKGAWLDRIRWLLRKDEIPAQAKALVRRMEDSIFELAQHKDNAHAIQGALIALGALHQYIATSPKLQSSISPVAILTEKWAIYADDGSDEFRIATALAGLYGKDMPMRINVLPLILGKWGKASWRPGSQSAVWGRGNLVRNLVAILKRRLMEAKQKGMDDKPLFGTCPCDLKAVTAFLSGHVDETRIAALIAGLVLVKLPWELPYREKDYDPIPGAYAFLKPLFTPDEVLLKVGVLAKDRKLPLPSGLIAQFVGSGSSYAMRMAWQRLQASAIPVPPFPPDLAGLNCERLVAGLLIPLRYGEIRKLFKRIRSLKKKDLSEKLEIEMEE